MTVLLTAVFAETFVGCADNSASTPTLLSLGKHLLIPKQSEVSLTSEEMGDEVVRETLAPIILMNNNEIAPAWA